MGLDLKVVGGEEVQEGLECNDVYKGGRMVPRFEKTIHRFHSMVIEKMTNRKKIVNHFLKLGFTSVSLDLEGIVSGKLNRGIKN